MICFLKSSKASVSNLRHRDDWELHKQIKKTVRIWREMDLHCVAIFRNWEGQKRLFTRGDKVSRLDLYYCHGFPFLGEYKQ